MNTVIAFLIFIGGVANATTPLSLSDGDDLYSKVVKKLFSDDRLLRIELAHARGTASQEYLEIFRGATNGGEECYIGVTFTPHFTILPLLRSLTADEYFAYHTGGEFRYHWWVGSDLTKPKIISAVKVSYEAPRFRSQTEPFTPERSPLKDGFESVELNNHSVYPAVGAYWTKAREPGVAINFLSPHNAHGRSGRYHLNSLSRWWVDGHNVSFSTTDGEKWRDRATLWIRMDGRNQVPIDSLFTRTKRDWWQRNVSSNEDRIETIDCRFRLMYSSRTHETPARSM